MTHSASGCKSTWQNLEDLKYAYQSIEMSVTHALNAFNTSVFCSWGIKCTLKELALLPLVHLRNRLIVINSRLTSWINQIG